jgi:hypothetical protein
MTQIVALIELPSGILQLAESLGASHELEVALPLGEYRVLLDEQGGMIRIESVTAPGPFVLGAELGSLVIEGYTALVGDADALERASDRDGERFWSELFSKIAASPDGIAAGSLELVSGMRVAYTGMREGSHSVRELLDATGRRRGVFVEG